MNSHDRDTHIGEDNEARGVEIRRRVPELVAQLELGDRGPEAKHRSTVQVHMHRVRRVVTALARWGIRKHPLGQIAVVDVDPFKGDPLDGVSTDHRESRG
eukprot:5291405-Prymnesium_polylepis.1